MKQFTSVSTLLLVILAVYWSFYALMPVYRPDANLAESSFSTDRALRHVEQMAAAPHGLGFPAHEKVKRYIMAQLGAMGLEVTLQEDYSLGIGGGDLSRPSNILARIKGSGSGKALLLLSHYDSDPHAAMGASDAASGVATIMEGIRAFWSEGILPENDIIILFTDSEEQDLNGAKLFVNHHPWAREIGLVLNFEARGSGGPGIMLIETNRGNQKLIEEFTAANPHYPVANSLAYSVYKMLPNDTDLTVFREDRDIDGFNFAFIDDHYDYHTARDTYDRLDRSTLAHQGSYLMPLLHYFGNADLNNLKSLNDNIYFNIPFFKLVSYPFEFNWPMFALALFFFVLLVIHGWRKKVLQLKPMGKGFIPMLVALAINGVVGFYCWPLLKKLYPQYKDILHGFTYNGYTYIMAFVLFAAAVCFWVYHRYRKISTANLLVAPIVLWLIVCGFLAAYLPGASFFIIPVFALLAAFLMAVNQEFPNPYLLLFLGLPALWIHAPLIRLFPVGLGLKMMISATLLVTLTFLLLLPLFSFYKNKNQLAVLGFVLFIGFMVSAHLGAGFDADRPKPTSLVYLLDADHKTAKWATYEQVISDWTSQYIGDNKSIAADSGDETISSKYSTGFTYVSEAPVKGIEPPGIEKTKDTIIGGDRLLEICITPRREVNRLDIFTNDIPVKRATVNGTVLSEYYLNGRRRGANLVTHYISNNGYTEIALTIPKDSDLELKFYEASNDLLNNSLFTVPPRPDSAIPMPFVLNDAIIVTKTLHF